ncbi:MAG: hypothetical protein K6T71_08055, partial [Candidatus Bipolaricaulota bacterium]|nr:hypothetical protein [Candidatus Bipolaricaulota bacterium]
MRRVISPVRSLKGVVRVPGDKSISHRALIWGALADGAVCIGNLSPARDVAHTAMCLQALGVIVQPLSSVPSPSPPSPKPLTPVLPSPSQGRGGGGEGEPSGRLIHNATGFSPPSRALDAGNSGTTMRLLAGLLAGQDFTATLTGDASLQRRPMKRVIEPLTQMGAKIESNGGFAPLKIRGQKLRGIRYELSVASSQVKSALLLEGLHAQLEYLFSPGNRDERRLRGRAIRFKGSAAFAELLRRYV